MVHLNQDKVQTISDILHHYYDEYIHLYLLTKKSIYKNVAKDFFEAFLKIFDIVEPNET